MFSKYGFAHGFECDFMHCFKYGCSALATCGAVCKLDASKGPLRRMPLQISESTNGCTEQRSYIHGLVAFPCILSLANDVVRGACGEHSRIGR